MPCAKYAKKPVFTGILAILRVGLDLHSVTEQVSLKSSVCQFGRLMSILPDITEALRETNQGVQQRIERGLIHSLASLKSLCLST